MKYLVVGAGLTGSVFARQMAEHGDEVTVIDKRNHVGGNVYDETPIGLPYLQKYGPHLFHTNSEKVVAYVRKFARWIPHYHKVKGYINGQFVDLPVNVNTIEALFPKDRAEAIIESLVNVYDWNKTVDLQTLIKDCSSGRFTSVVTEFAIFVKEAVFENYSKKAWGTDVFGLDPEILKRVPIRLNRDDRYFTDKFQAFPMHGFTYFVGEVLKHPMIKVFTGVAFRPEKAKDYDRVFYTGMIDQFFDYRFGALPYRSLKLDVLQVHNQDAQKYPTVNYPDHMYLTRSSDCTLLRPYTGVLRDTTNIIYEEPIPYDVTDDKHEPYYPIRSEDSRALYRKYEELTPPNVIFGGRLGRFEYLNMDAAIAQALSLAAKEQQYGP